MKRIGKGGRIKYGKDGRLTSWDVKKQTRNTRINNIKAFGMIILALLAINFVINVFGRVMGS